MQSVRAVCVCNCMIDFTRQDGRGLSDGAHGEKVWAPRVEFSCRPVGQAFGKEIR